MKRITKMKECYNTNKDSSKGSLCSCPSCNTEFTKGFYQQIFCKSKPGTQCKDKYWNTVDPKKRCNTTRISPASRRFMLARELERFNNFDPHDYEHPFSSEALGQWD